MFGNIIQGSHLFGDNLLGLSLTEVAADISTRRTGILIRSRAVFSSFHTKFRIPALDIVVDLKGPDQRHLPRMGFGSYGTFEEFGTTLYAGIGLMSYAEFINPEIVARGPVRFFFGSSHGFSLTHPDNNAIAWSDIGSLDFTINNSNVAGKMPIDWKGYVYAVEQLEKGNIVIVYGANGISKVVPVDVFFGSTQISNIGIKSKHAVVNTGVNHYFVNANNVMFKISPEGKISKLGYQEFLSQLGDIVMSYDSFNEMVYICDGTLGFIYSEDSESFGAGPGNVTGVKWQDEVQYVGAPEEISSHDFLLVTDIYDMGTKKEKTLMDVTICANDVTGLQVGVDYRVFPKDEFKTIPYFNVNPHGIVKTPCYGREFRIRVKGTNVAADFKLESITVTGVIHGYNYLDTTSN